LASIHELELLTHSYVPRGSDYQSDDPSTASATSKSLEENVDTGKPIASVQELRQDIDMSVHSVSVTGAASDLHNEVDHAFDRTYFDPSSQGYRLT
jgi:hypothetical protein